MEILGIGPLELIVILVIALIFVGPERLPEIARQIGKTVRYLRSMSSVVMAEWQREFSEAAQIDLNQQNLKQVLGEPLKEVQADIQRVLNEPATSVRSDLTSVQADLDRALSGPVVKPVPANPGGDTAAPGGPTGTPAVAVPQPAVGAGTPASDGNLGAPPAAAADPLPPAAGEPDGGTERAE
jgi:sec-independent protein translocase protein TatB